MVRKCDVDGAKALLTDRAECSPDAFVGEIPGVAVDASVHREWSGA